MTPKKVADCGVFGGTHGRGGRGGREGITARSVRSAKNAEEEGMGGHIRHRGHKKSREGKGRERRGGGKGTGLVARQTAILAVCGKHAGCVPM